LFTLANVKLQLSSVFHPQSDGLSEAVNKVIAMYLRCLAGDRPRQWLQWLPWAEYCYNTTFHSSLKTTPFRVVYGRDPPSLHAYVHGEAQLPAIHHQLQDRNEFLQEVCDRLEQAQTHYKLQYDCNHRDLEFHMGEWAWLHLLHRLIASLQVADRGKLGPKHYGLFKVLDRVGTVAYMLQLPKGAKLHDGFHVGLLKKYYEQTTDEPGVLPRICHGRACLEPAARGREEVLVR
jgi:hypothetical protein